MLRRLSCTCLDKGYINARQIRQNTRLHHIRFPRLRFSYFNGATRKAKQQDQNDEKTGI